MFRARLPSIFITSYNTPRLPRNQHPVTTWRSPANGICKKHATRHVQSAASATQNCNASSENVAKVLGLPHKTIFDTFLEATFPYIIFRKSSHTMFSSYSRPGFWYVTVIGISAQSEGNSWAMANPLNAPPQLSNPYVVPKQLWTLDELKAALIRGFPHLSTEEGQGCQR